MFCAILLKNIVCYFNVLFPIRIFLFESLGIAFIFNSAPLKLIFRIQIFHSYLLLKYFSLKLVFICFVIDIFISWRCRIGIDILLCVGILTTIFIRTLYSAVKLALIFNEFFWLQPLIILKLNYRSQLFGHFYNSSKYIINSTLKGNLFK
jgi:hypothetical protein